MTAIHICDDQNFISHYVSHLTLAIYYPIASDKTMSMARFLNFSPYISTGFSPDLGNPLIDEIYNDLFNCSFSLQIMEFSSHIT